MGEKKILEPIPDYVWFCATTTTTTTATATTRARFDLQQRRRIILPASSARGQSWLSIPVRRGLSSTTKMQLQFEASPTRLNRSQSERQTHGGRDHNRG